MKISKIHQKFSYYLQLFHNIPKQQVLNHPENYLGPNWETVINFWIYLDSLTQEQLKIIEKRYCVLSDEELDKAWNKAFDAADKTTDVYLAANAALDSVSYARFAVSYSTYELIGLEKLLNRGHQLVFFPLFLNL